jgi:site-specific recombinase XerD
MTKEYSISIFLDTRRTKANGKFPVKLRVFTASPRKQKLFPTTFEFTQKEFEQIWKNQKTRTEFKDVKREIQSIESKANDTAKELSPFSMDQFEKRLFRNSGDGVNLNFHYKTIIDELTRRGQLNTGDAYRMSQKSFTEFAKVVKSQKFDKLTFYDITVEWLKDYEDYYTQIKKGSLTTVSIYTRNLRAVFNRAIEEKDIENECYPFGKRKYQPPSTKNVKKSLSVEQLGTLFHAEAITPEQQKAKDFWFFSYACNGMNFKDIALLKFKDITNDKIEFVRAKTALTSKSNLKPITVYLNDFTNEIISKYGNENKHSENLVFDIVNENLQPHQIQAKIKNFTRFTNQHLKKLCIKNDLPSEISTYWARHTFATNSIRNGASMEFISESLGHGNLKTTQGYFAGFDSETKREFAKKIMDFKNDRIE